MWCRRGIAALVCVIAATAGTSCVHRFIEPHAGGVVVKSDQIGWYTKKVVTKRPPEVLLAEDGTICRVAPDRFAGTANGALVYCHWQ